VYLKCFFLKTAFVSSFLIFSLPFIMMKTNYSDKLYYYCKAMNTVIHENMFLSDEVYKLC
jgi:hypothetical protein